MSRLWSAAATGATPYAESAGRYSSANGRLRFAPGRTGKMHFVCNVTNVRELASVRHLAVTYRDAGRKQAGQGEVIAVLKKVSFANGSIENLLGIGSPSNEAGPTEWTTTTSVALDASEIPLDDSNHYYYIVITLERDDVEDQNPTVLGVSLVAGV